MSIVKVIILSLILLSPTRSYALYSVCGTTKVCEVITGMATTSIATVGFFLGLEGAFRFGRWLFHDPNSNQMSEPLPSKWDSLAWKFNDFLDNPKACNLDNDFKLTNESDVRIAFDAINNAARHNKKFLMLTGENVAHLSDEWKLVLENTRMQLEYEDVGVLDFSYTHEFLSKEDYERVVREFNGMLAHPEIP